MKPLSDLARAFINRYQGGFPVTEPRPYARVAAEIGCTEGGLLALIHELVDDGSLSRFGPIYDASRLGGEQTLAALEVPEERYDAVADCVNALPEVAHNYRREHRLNMWFVVAAPGPGAVAATLAAIERETGLRVFNFPKLHEFYLGLWLALGPDGRVETVPVPRQGRTAALIGQAPDAVDFRIINATQRGLPLVADPLQAIADKAAVDRSQVGRCLQDMLASGAIRRIGAVPNHYRLGLRGNGMTVWDVPDELAVVLGEQVGALDFVSHSYLRPRHPGVWRYNLFAMVHGHARDEVLEKTARVADILGPDCRAHNVLFSTAVLKKTGLRLAA